MNLENSVNEHAPENFLNNYWVKGSDILEKILGTLMKILKTSWKSSGTNGRCQENILYSKDSNQWTTYTLISLESNFNQIRDSFVLTPALLGDHLASNVATMIYAKRQSLIKKGVWKLLIQYCTIKFIDALLKVGILYLKWYDISSNENSGYGDSTGTTHRIVRFSM